MLSPAHQQVPIWWLERKAAAAIANGLSIDSLLECALINRTSEGGQGTVSALHSIVFYASLVLQTDDATHSLVRDRLPPAAGPMSLQLLLGGPTLGEGLVSLVKFYELTSSRIRFHTATQGDRAFLGIHIDDDRWGVLEEDTFLIYVYFALTAFLNSPVPVAWVNTRDPDHFSLGRPHYLMQGPVKLDRCAGIAFPKALLGARSAAEGLEEFGWTPIDRALSLIGMAHDPHAIDVGHRRLQVDTLAAEQMMAPSTYRRMIAREGPGFRKLREQVLVNAVLAQIEASAGSFEAIAAELGYADARSLRRFVKRATGLTPDELRRSRDNATSPLKLRARLKEIIGSALA